ncbi:ATP-binding protein [Candidatus Pacearchaeota archaeon]|nr:ATP-binding protein [Candidatus Pacearchaeota archaeon]
MIKDVLIIQKRELANKLKETYVERDVQKKGVDSNIVKVIIGPRRAGKSSFAVHLLPKNKNFGYVNFDDEKLVDVKDYDEIINALNSLYKNPKYILFDEIQNLKKWELFVNRLQRQGYNLLITGSNSKLLSQELSTHLTGRHFLINLFPFSFKEFLKLEEKELTQNEIREMLTSYLTYGGYPEPLVKKLDYKEYLSTLFNSVLYKDIVKRFKIRFVQGLEDLSSYILSNIAQEFSYNALAKLTKCKSVHTVEKYLGYMEEAFIFFKINRFSYKIKEQLSSNKKIYCIDNGFIYAKSFKSSPDFGKLYENTVAIELKKLEVDGTAQVYYWKNAQQEEVDFVIKDGLKVKKLIQVCYKYDLKTKDREIRALIKASKELKCNNLVLITENEEGYKEVEWFNTKRKIQYVPLWKWLLESKK